MWIRYLGFGKLERVFVDNCVDLRTIPIIKENDFEQLGITCNKQDTTRFLDAIKYYREYSSAEGTLPFRNHFMPKSETQLLENSFFYYLPPPLE